MEKIILILRQFGVVILLGMVGVGILIYGIFGEVAPKKAVVEIVKGENKEQSNIEDIEGQMIVDVAGAVEKPGLYKLQRNSRIGDALVMAGGLSSSADRQVISKTINLAEILEDGSKIYIPELGSITTQNEKKMSGLININTASMLELDGLVGIGAVRVAAIVENRPYSKIEELTSKAGIAESIVEKINDQISVY